MKFYLIIFFIICFFIAYKFYGIYVATVVAIIVSALQVSTYWIRFHRFEKFHLIALIFTLLLGGCTSIFHKAIFIKWKPTIITGHFQLFY